MTSVTEALRGLKLGAREIANKSHLPLDRVEAILAGDKVALSEVRAISSGLRLPMHVLAKGSQVNQPGSRLSPLFRNTQADGDHFDVTIEKVGAFVEAALQILPHRETIPAWLSELSVNELSYVEADRVAKLLRQRLFDLPDEEPAIDLPKRAANLEGMIISRLLYSRYEGVSLIADNYSFVFVSPRFSGRMLFTLGHEIGHLIAHHKNGSAALFERPSAIGSFGSGSRDEAFVDAFSSCLLLPDVGVGKTLRVLREHFGITSKNVTDVELLALARFYGVSFEVAARRCEDLGLLPKGLGHALAARLKKEFGSPEKRADMLGLPPRVPVEIPPISPVLADALAKKINLGEISIGWASDQFGLSIAEILSSNTKPLAS